MDDLKQLRAIIRPEAAPRLVHELQDAGVARFWVSRIHSLGAGVDPDHFRLSMDDEGSYTEKAIVEFLCPQGDVEALLARVRKAAATGHRGDGVVIISDVTDVVGVRTGDRGGLALL